MVTYYVCTEEALRERLAITHHFLSFWYNHKDLYGICVFIFGNFLFCMLITARIRRMGEGNVLKRVCPSMILSVHRGGYPYPIMLCNISQNAMRQRGGTRVRYPPGGVPRSGTPRVRYPPRGVPDQVPPRGGPGQVHPPGGGTRVRYPPGGYPGQVPPPGGYPGQVPPPRGGYPGRTTEGVLTTRRAVCLLRSRRRTFLLFVFLAQLFKIQTRYIYDQLFDHVLKWRYLHGPASL